ncbi:MerR family DNA-binding transcriptional regulator [Micromonospora sp. C31]|uniref:DNA polymerase III subunit beta family protein n=1 Tax=Micromonospora sp. C31 TaxID=2824876 RepID=UPI001B37E401|nr:MerR family DNA-binding transcriptional regulator [Micromonospora sp. C31]MBQ1075858.1 MerR family DNA-binding transcriptional regulator [Micromonospora sp. C31]
MRSIGELARASGLTVSALRFYDSAGVLIPALVDPVTGYRWYTGDQVAPARLVAGLRRVGMPVTEIAAALRVEPAQVHRLLDAHLRRLEDGLADARRELSRIRTLIDSEEPVMTTCLVMSRADLAAAVDAVRFAVGTDPDLPAMAGVLFESDAAGVWLVATDRYRLAVARAAARVDGPAVRVLAPVTFVDELRALLDGGVGRTTEARLTVTAGTISFATAGHALDAAAMPYDFPDHRRLVRMAPDGPAHRLTIDTAALRTALTSADAPVVTRRHDGAPLAVTVLGPDGRGGVRLLGADELTRQEDTFRIGVNGGYLLQALDAAGRGQLLLELDGPIAPLAVRRPDDADAFSILMPIQL